MAQKINAIKIKQANGSYTGEIPFGINAANVFYQKRPLTGVLGDIDTTTTLAEQFTALQGECEAIKHSTGTPIVIKDMAERIDEDKIYVYNPDTPDTDSGKWYYYDKDTSSWAEGGQYQSASVTVDATLQAQDVPADAKAVGDAIKITKKETMQAIADEYDATKTYYPLAYTLKNNIIYKNKSDSLVTGAWNSDKWQPINSLTEEINNEHAAIREQANTILMATYDENSTIQFVETEANKNFASLEVKITDSSKLTARSVAITHTGANSESNVITIKLPATGDLTNSIIDVVNSTITLNNGTTAAVTVTNSNGQLQHYLGLNTLTLVPANCGVIIFSHDLNIDGHLAVNNYKLASSLINENNLMSATASKAYAVNDYLIMNNILYRVTAPIASGESIVENTNVVTTTVTEELTRLAEILDNLSNNSNP